MSAKTFSPIIDLRMYTHQPNRRDEFIQLFEDQFIETQEAVGIQVIGMFRDLDDPDRCIWIRGFNDMSAREKSLTTFYTGPVWKEYRDAANATLIDSDNVLLLRLAHPNSGFVLNGNHPALNSRAEQDGFIAASILYFDSPVDSDFINYFENTIKPVLSTAGASLLAQSASKPNVVLVLMDNLGWGELGVYGGGVLRGAPTPRIDKLASEGLRLLNFNV